MACRKRRLDEIGAKLRLAEIARRDNVKRPKTELRAYFCRYCRAWHLTSEPPRKSESSDSGS